MLLRAALTEARWAARVTDALGAESFQEPRYRGVAQAILGHDEEWSSRLQAVWADPELTETASGLLVVEEGPPLSDEQVEGALSRLVERRKRWRRQELQRKILQGLIGKDDDEYHEYLRLL